MSIETTKITFTERGDETHPSWITIRANRISGNRRLFDSEITHQHFVRVEINRCTRKRGLHRDWIHSTETIAEIDMSMAQWGGFVSSFGDGSGVPVTLAYLNGERIPDAPYESRIATSIAETKVAAQRMVDEIEEAYQAVQDGFDSKLGRREMGPLLNTLRHKIGNTPANVQFAASSLTEHVEFTVAKARGDVEAMVTHAVAAAGIEPGTLDVPALALLEGDVIDVDSTEA